MTTIAKHPTPRSLAESIERGLNRMLTSPTSRIRDMRVELEREERARRERFEVTSKQSRQTLQMVTSYLRSLPNS